MTLTELQAILTEYVPTGYRFLAEPYTLLPEERRARERRKGSGKATKGYHADIYRGDVIVTVWVPTTVQPAFARMLICKAVIDAQHKYQSTSTHEAIKAVTL